MGAVEEVLKSRLLGLAEHMPAALFITDQENKIVLINRRLGGFFQIDQPILGGTSNMVFAALESALGDPLGFRVFVQLASIKESEPKRFFTKDGRTLKVEHVFLREKSAGCEHLWIFTDVSERVMTDALLDRQRAQIVESAKLKALGEMAGGIAHEINNPLAIIQSRACAKIFDEL